MNRTITSVSIENLFGRYSYDLRLSEQEDLEGPRLSLLYGDNGTGKTTILKLVFHLLSSELSRGHKTYIANVPFRRLCVSFSDGTEICASRCSDELIGNFEISVASREHTPSSAKFHIHPETRAITQASLSEEAADLLLRIASLELQLFYLGDSRDLEGDSIPVHDPGWYSRQAIISHPRYMGTLLEGSSGDERPQSYLVESILRAERWLDREAIRTSSVGDTDAQQIYGSILETAASASAVEASDLEGEVKSLKKQIKQIEMTSRDFAMFGLGSAIDSAAPLESLERANDFSLPIVVQLLGPILQGQRARLDAVTALYEKVHGFVNIVNDYLTDKEVNFDAGKGLVIQLPNQALDPDLLSTGEKHLLLLFLSVFTSSERSPLFIIDEPELSLNIKWQRTLVDSLLSLSKESNCQFLLATHSIELLTKHMDCVVGLHPHG